MTSKDHVDFHFNDVDSDFEFVTLDNYEGDTLNNRSNVSSSSMTLNEIANEAKLLMKGMKELLADVSTGTATRAEKNKLLSLNKKLSVMKKSAHEARMNQTHDLEVIRERNALKVNDIVRSMRMNDIKNIASIISDSESVDLAFIMDCTGSMGAHIEMVKSNIKLIVKQIQKSNPYLQLRLSIIAYRDIGDGQNRFEVLDFVSSTEQFETFLSGLKANGGADGPEDIAGAIQKANALSWSNLTRVSFLIADYPCHGSEFNNGMADDYPSGTPDIDIIEELRQLLSLHSEDGSMSLYFGRILSYTDYMIQCFQKNYLLDIQVVPVDDCKKLKESVTSSVRRSIFKTVTMSRDTRSHVGFSIPTDPKSLIGTRAAKGLHKYHLRSFSLVDSFPSRDEWKTCCPIVVKVYRNVKINSVNELKKPIGFGVLRSKKQKTEKTTHSTMMMRRAPNPFAQGETRIAFHGQLAPTKEELSLEKSTMVMKVFKHVGEGVNNREQYLKQMEVSNIAHFLACLYNASHRPENCSSIHFLPVCVIEEVGGTREISGESRLCVEPPLPKETFQKFSNNTGYWDDTILDESLLRFTLWSRDITEGYLMVTDLQGVKKDDVIYLTDPVVLCSDITRFGRTNLGEEFMKRCTQSTKAYLREYFE